MNINNIISATILLKDTVQETGEYVYLIYRVQLFGDYNQEHSMHALFDEECIDCETCITKSDVVLRGAVARCKIR